MVNLEISKIMLILLILNAISQVISRQIAYRTRATIRRASARKLLKQVWRMIHLLQRMKQICALLQRRYVKLQSTLNYLELSMKFIRIIRKSKRNIKLLVKIIRVYKKHSESLIEEVKSFLSVKDDFYK